jgi:hypothetical protein
MSTRDLAAGELENVADRPTVPSGVAAVAFAAAILGAVALPGQPVGAGVFLVGAMVSGAVALGRPRERVTAEMAGLAVLGLALSAMTVVRSAEWVLFFDLVFALWLATLVVAGGAEWRHFTRAPLVVASRIHQALPLMARSVGLGGRLGGRLGGAAPAARGVVLAAVLLLVFGGLFLAADAAFAQLARDWLLPSWDLGLLPARIVVFGFVLALAGALTAAGNRFKALGRPWLLPDPETRPSGKRHALGRTEWVIALGVLDLLFVAFVIVQVAVLFGGRDHVLDTVGLTYAEYARQGFFQLVTVAVLTLGVVAVSIRWARTDRGADRLVLQLLLGVLCVLTLVVLLSALRRLQLYESTFGFTRLRVSVQATILWLGGLFVLVMLAGAMWRGHWLPRAAVVFTGVSLLVFSLIDPDALIASKNVERFERTGRIDLAYLTLLSADAVPALSRLPVPLARCALWPHADLVDEHESALAWNYGRQRARDSLGPGLPRSPGIACHQAYRMGLRL